VPGSVVLLQVKDLLVRLDADDSQDG
jgi:hypothetical protein